MDAVDRMSFSRYMDIAAERAERRLEREADKAGGVAGGRTTLLQRGTIDDIFG